MARASRRDEVRAARRLRRRAAQDPRTHRRRPPRPHADTRARARRGRSLAREHHIRVGNDAYAKQNSSFGLTTLRDEHVSVAGARVRFRFRGKSGVRHEIDLSDRRIARVIQRLDDLPGQHLFQYLGDDGEPTPIDSDDVNEYLRETTGQDFTAKHFRTWAGTVLTARALAAIGGAETEREAKRNLVAAIEDVSTKLGNTPTVCRTCYVHPAIVEGYRDGSLLRQVRRRFAEPTDPNDLDPDERWVLRVLRADAKKIPQAA